MKYTKIYIVIFIAAVLLWVLCRNWFGASSEEEVMPQTELIPIGGIDSPNVVKEEVQDSLPVKKERAKVNKPVVVLPVNPEPLAVEESQKNLPILNIQPLLTEGAVKVMADEAVGRDSILLAVRMPEKKAPIEWDNDTLPVKKGIDLLRIKKIGRYDRGIVNYRFMPEGAWMFGIDASFWDFDSENNKMLFAYLDDFNFNARTCSFSPFLGYFIKDNQEIGIKLGYKYTDGYLGNISIKIDDDMNFSLKELKFEENIYNCSFFHRSYIGLDKGKRFGLFNETSLNFGFGNSEFKRGSGEELKSMKTNIFEARVGMSPGLSVFIMQNISVECSVGILGLRFRRETQMNNLGESGSRANGGANFKVNLFDINLGMVISL